MQYAGRSGYVDTSSMSIKWNDQQIKWIDAIDD